MKELEQLKELLAARFPDAVLSIEENILDVVTENDFIIVEYRPDHGFRVSAKKVHYYVDGIKELLPNVDETLNHVTEIICK